MGDNFSTLEHFQGPCWQFSPNQSQKCKGIFFSISKNKDNKNEHTVWLLCIPILESVTRIQDTGFQNIWVLSRSRDTKESGSRCPSSKALMTQCWGVSWNLGSNISGGQAPGRQAVSVVFTSLWSYWIILLLFLFGASAHVSNPGKCKFSNIPLRYFIPAQTTHQIKPSLNNKCRFSKNL